MAKASKSSELYTLTEVSSETGISMPTLQRYKKLYQDRIPSEGRGRSQRYPQEALEVFRQLKEENLGRRGRPRTRPRPDSEGDAGEERRGSRIRQRRERRRGRGGAAASGKGEGRSAGRGEGSSAGTAKRKEAAGEGGAAGDLLTLTQIGEQTGISYPTLMRYVKMHSDEIPHVGTGRRRRYRPEAVEVFRDLRSRSRRGRRPAGDKTTSDKKIGEKKTGERKPSVKRQSAASASQAQPTSSAAGRAARSAASAAAGAGGNDDVSRRLDRLEAALGRIEEMLSGGIRLRFGKG